MVRRRAGGDVQHCTAGTECIGCLIVRAIADGLADEGSCFGPFSKLRRVEVFLVAERRKDVLTVLNVISDVGN